MSMAPLDHSSNASFIADLDRHYWRGSVFRFKYTSDKTTVPWILVSASARVDGHLYIEYEHEHGATADPPAKVWQCNFRLDGGWLIPPHGGGAVKVVAGRPRSSRFQDDSLRNRLDENLKGVFS